MCVYEKGWGGGEGGRCHAKQDVDTHGDDLGLEEVTDPCNVCPTPVSYVILVRLSLSLSLRGKSGFETAKGSDQEAYILELYRIADLR
ncbi:hypothetical protein TIFTF001_003771 [Ficus carica]|uniref:Uncharacterized protein n=1 Tax=Ficus carica TaxID=3494 RepID=A0AA87ZIG6_FICCA|nr:hypothetical protein TIFTF001_003771 [Ficus carica]